MHIEYWKKNISVLAKATQVSNVAHGPLVERVMPPEFRRIFKFSGHFFFFGHLCRYKIETWFIDL
jgi:hypothetical protein